MLPIRLDDVFSALGTTDDKAAIVWLDKHIPRTCPLDVDYDLANRAPLSKAQSGVFTSRNTRLVLIPFRLRRWFVCVGHMPSSRNRSAPDGDGLRARRAKRAT